MLLTEQRSVSHPAADKSPSYTLTNTSRLSRGLKWASFGPLHLWCPLLHAHPITHWKRKIASCFSFSFLPPLIGPSVLSAEGPVFTLLSCWPYVGVSSWRHRKLFPLWKPGHNRNHTNLCTIRGKISVLPWGGFTWSCLKSLGFKRPKKSTVKSAAA